MNKFILARLLQTIPVLILVSILTFAGLELVPGDPVEALIGPANEGNPIDAEGIETAQRAVRPDGFASRALLQLHRAR